MTVSAPATLPNEEIARLGDEIYERRIRPKVEAENLGRIVAIDVDSESWAIADSELVEAERLRQQRSDASHVWLLRVGYRAVASIGASTTNSDRVPPAESEELHYRQQHSARQCNTQTKQPA